MASMLSGSGSSRFRWHCTQGARLQSQSPCKYRQSMEVKPRPCITKYQCQFQDLVHFSDVRAGWGLEPACDRMFEGTFHAACPIVVAPFRYQELGNAHHDLYDRLYHSLAHSGADSISRSPCTSRHRHQGPSHGRKHREFFRLLCLDRTK